MKLYVIGLSSDNRRKMNSASETAVRESSLMIGCSAYIRALKNWFPEKDYAVTSMEHMKECVCFALNEAQTQTVSLICGDDTELYNVAGLTLELSENYPDTEVKIVSEITAMTF